MKHEDTDKDDALSNPETDRLSKLEVIADSLETLDLGLAVFDDRDQLIFADRSFARCCGRDPGELSGLSMKEVAEFICADPDRFVKDLRDSNGCCSTRQRNGRLSRIESSLGKNGTLVMTCREIVSPEGLASEMAARIIESCPLPLVVSRLEDRTILYESPANNRLFGETAETKAAKVGAYDENPRERAAFLEKLKSEGTVSDFEIRFRRTDGSRFVAALSAAVIELGGEDVVISGAIDVTDRVEREATLRRILDACPIAISLVRVADDSIVYETREAETLFGPREDGSKGALGRWISADDRETYLKQLRSSGRLDSVEATFRRSDGSAFQGALSARMIDYGGEEVAVFTVFDLSERLAAEQEMARQREALHQSEKLSAMGQLLASVSHELNNPLSVVVGQSMLLQETARDEAQAKRSGQIAKAASRCARIVKSFLTMARQQPQESQWVGPNELIESALELTAYALRTSGIEVHTDFAADLPDVLVDADQVTQVFTNLIINAEHALLDAAQSRRIDINSRYDQQKREVVVEVADSGPGIPDDIRSRIFEPYFTSKAEGSGTGIGLTLCHRILENHGGSISLLDRPAGAGAAFAVRLPVAEGAPGPEEEEEGAWQAPQGISVLVIDDEADVADLIAEVLSFDGIEVEIARSGRRALQRIAESRFDFILSDVRMPEMGGRAFYRELEVHWPDMVSRCAFLTGDILNAEIGQFLEASGSPFAEKPLAPGDIRRLLRRLIEAQEAGTNQD